MPASIGAKIKEIRTLLRLTQEEFGARAGIPLSTLKKYEGDDREPGSDALAGIARLGANINWLLSDQFEGPPLLSDRTVREQPGEYVAIPLVGVHAAAGGGAIVESEHVVDVLHFKQDWVRNELRANVNDLRLLYVEGESMEPYLRAGDVILINTLDTTPKRDAIYVLRMEDALLVKRLQRLPNGVIKVSSDNPAYQSFEITSKDYDGIAIVGRVVWMGRRT